MVDRRTFVALFATSAGSPLLSSVLPAQIRPGTLNIAAARIREAAALAGLTWTDAESQEVADALSSFASHAERIDKDSLSNASPLPIHFDPRPPGVAVPMPRPAFRPPATPRVRRPANLEEAAFWSIARLAELIRSRQVTATELTRMYLARLKRHNAALNCVVTLTEARALEEAAEADRELASGQYRGLLHGLPYGVKDIIAARGYPTTWGAPPLEQQTFDEDATVVRKLRDRGAVLVAKLSTGEFAFGDQWARGRTNNPWNPQEGSSGSSAGSAAATAAGLVAFAIGTDTGGSILSPGQRCGIAGLRPTFGSVSRHGVMAAGTSLDKVGPMCRYVADCAIVLHAISGADLLDRAVPDALGLAWDGTSTDYPKRVGYVRAMFDAETDPERRANNERALDTVRRLGCTLHDVALPDGDLSYFIEYIERAAAFDSFTRAGLHEGLRPRTSRYLRAGQLVTAVDYLQANRRRTAIMQEVARVLSTLDVILFTALTLDSRTSINPVMSLTGHPSIAVPSGRRAGGAPAGVMFSGQLYRDGELLAFAQAFERAAAPANREPPGFGPSG
ncbi:MAG TPA: amidase family protein [Vicinamibacterales bacterium]|nr:amidase family protein [Vicinamibacterales bacterium]